jgi:hypothetical protein
MASSTEARAQAQRATTRLLRLRHYRLTRTIERFQDKLAIVDQELAARGIVMPTHDKKPRRSISGLRHGEIGGLCVAILREAASPLRMREIVERIAGRKGYDQSDATFMAKVTKRTRGAMEKFSRQGVVLRTAAPTSKRGRWFLAPSDSWVAPPRRSL